MTESSDGTTVSFLARLYDRTVLQYPIVFVALLGAAVAYLASNLLDFKFDASSEAIVLQDDRDMKYYNRSRELFGSDDYVFVSVGPREDLFSDASLAALGDMVAEFQAMESISSVTSILNVPLFHSKEGLNPHIALMQVASGYGTLLGENTNRERAKAELTSSPLYKNYLISEEGDLTAIQVNFQEAPQEYNDLYNRRTRLREKRAEEGLTRDEKAELKRVESEYNLWHTRRSEERSVDIEQVRSILDKYQDDIGPLHLGGVPMIIADIISYVQNDILILGAGVVLVVLIVLGIIFRKPKWVVLPVVTCLMVVISMMGYMGLIHWRATIVTSNFPALLFVITIAMSVHIAARYREVFAGHPDLSNREITLMALRRVAIPCLFTTLTTMVGFGSLIVSRMPPVMDFGQIMFIGLGASYVLCFVFLPAALQYFPKGKTPSEKFAQLEKSPLRVFAWMTDKFGWGMAALALVVLGVSIYGITKVQVENRFIDYFKPGTPIRQGMTLIDQELGGTIPLEVVMEGEGKDFWIDHENLAKLEMVHNYVDDLPESGKVISPDTMVQMLEGIVNPRLEDGEREKVPIPIIQQALNMVPDEIETAAIGPYITPDRDKVRVTTRAQESSKDLRRADLLERMNRDLAAMEELEGIDVRVTGLLVLYSNLLQNLYDSQIKTIGAVFLAIWVMFLLLFRSFSVATIAIIPNVLPVAVVLGALGLIGIPLDMMTIMTAAITLGIAVDDCIHYIHRFKEEFEKDNDYVKAMYRSHNSVGRPVYYTSLTITAGFLVLTASNFIPNIYFGLFTSLAMFVALIAALTILPLLLIKWKPFGPGREAEPETA